MAEDTSYKPISDYGAVGNLRTVALVARDGSIDWWCAPHMDSPSVFCALLDPQRGGQFSVRPRGGRPVAQRYLEDTNVLETELGGDGGHLSVIDFMPLAGDLDGRGDRAWAPPVLCRVLTSPPEVGVDVELSWAPRFDFARARTEMHRTEHGAVAEGGGERLWLEGLPLGAAVTLADDGEGPVCRARFRLGAGRRVPLVASLGERAPLGERVIEAMAATVEAWRRWLHKHEAGERQWAAPHARLAMRSELLLKLLVHADTGGLVAAPTASLPEEIGGVRNWDYRFAWLRDSALVAQSLIAIGHTAEIKAFLRWAEEVSRPQIERGVEPCVLYALRGEDPAPETTLDHLAGYAHSRPVRIGNAAASQLQHDVLGDLSSSAYELLRRNDIEPDISDEVAEMLCVVADQASSRWREPDHGIWEMRTGPHHYVFSKAKAWDALTRAISLQRAGILRGDVDRWREARREIERDVAARGFDEERGAFVMAYDKRELDAANLQLALTEFLAADDPRFAGTLDRTLATLTERGLVYRYLADDGLPGDEGAFVLCTFWLVDALALCGRSDEARQIFDGIAGRANHLGLFSEQIEPTTGRFLGNFPQAFSHVGLINSLLYLAYAEGRPLPIRSLVGTREHRREADLM